MAERDEGEWTKNLLLSPSTAVLHGVAAVDAVQIDGGRIAVVGCQRYAVFIEGDTEAAMS